AVGARTPARADARLEAVPGGLPALRSDRLADRLLALGSDVADPRRVRGDLRADGRAAGAGAEGEGRRQPAAGVDRHQLRVHVLRARLHLLAGAPRWVPRRNAPGLAPGLRAA